MLSIKEQTLLTKEVNRHQVKKALYQKSLAQETNKALIEEYQKGISEADAATRAVLSVLGNVFNLGCKVSTYRADDAFELASKYGLDYGQITGPVVYNEYEITGPVSHGEDAGETAKAE